MCSFIIKHKCIGPFGINFKVGGIQEQKQFDRAQWNIYQEVAGWRTVIKLEKRAIKDN